MYTFKALVLLNIVFFQFYLFNSVKCTVSERKININDEIKKDKNIAVLLTKECCNCKPCVEAEMIIKAIQHQLMDSYDIAVVTLVGQTELEKEYGIRQHPSLLYFRNGIPALYEGPYEAEHIIDWLALNRDPLVKNLDDTNFEHLTQAATGATTGNWLISFYNPSCLNEPEHISILEGLATNSKHKLIVAKVDTSKSPELVSRFKIKKCPNIWYFRLGRMYEYTLPKININFLQLFSEKTYRDSKAYSVPIPQSSFDKLIDEIVAYIKKNPQVRYYAIGGIGIIYVIHYLLTKKPKEDPKKKK